MQPPPWTAKTEYKLKTALIQKKNLSLNPNRSLNVNLNLSQIPGGDSVTFGTGVLMCLFGVGEIIWGLKFWGHKCATCGLKCGVGEVFWAWYF